jgi:hypothetical protein
MYDMCEFRRRHYSPSLQKGSKNKYQQRGEAFFCLFRRLCEANRSPSTRRGANNTRGPSETPDSRPYGATNCKCKYLECLSPRLGRVRSSAERIKVMSGQSTTWLVGSVAPRRFSTRESLRTRSDSFPAIIAFSAARKTRFAYREASDE